MCIHEAVNPTREQEKEGHARISTFYFLGQVITKIIVLEETTSKV